MGQSQEQRHETRDTRRPTGIWWRMVVIGFGICMVVLVGAPPALLIVAAT